MTPAARRAVFVTGAGTDVGKTFVTCGLLRHLRASGVTVAALKPVVSGFSPETRASSDSAFLLQALGREVTDAALAEISPWRFREPLSPDMAARRESRAIDVAEVVRHSREAIAASEAGLLAIEGVGGVYVPLSATETVADWIEALGIPVVLVCGTYLGALSHALTALHVLLARGASVCALVASESVHAPVSLDETVETLARFSRGVPVIGVSRDARMSDPAYAVIAERVLLDPRRTRLS